MKIISFTFTMIGGRVAAISIAVLALSVEAKGKSNSKSQSTGYARVPNGYVIANPTQYGAKYGIPTGYAPPSYGTNGYGAVTYRGGSSGSGSKSKSKSKSKSESKSKSNSKARSKSRSKSKSKRSKYGKNKYGKPTPTDPCAVPPGVTIPEGYKIAGCPAPGSGNGGTAGNGAGTGVPPEVYPTPVPSLPSYVSPDGDNIPTQPGTDLAPAPGPDEHTPPVDEIPDPNTIDGGAVLPGGDDGTVDEAGLQVAVAACSRTRATIVLTVVAGVAAFLF